MVVGLRGERVAGTSVVWVVAVSTVRTEGAADGLVLVAECTFGTVSMKLEANGKQGQDSGDSTARTVSGLFCSQISSTRSRHMIDHAGERLEAKRNSSRIRAVGRRPCCRDKK